ncbi:unnamed protein product [Alopecurus aequalis]
MARGKKDSQAAGGSGDLMEEEEAAAVVEEKEGGKEQAKRVEEEEEWKEDEEEEEEEDEEWVQEEDEQDEEEADEAHGEETAEGVAGEQGSPPKLAEGFYEIETIRRRRLRKGHLQYLVKWRGWPESANTWEPVENLKACSDFVESFEKRRQPRYYGKRKRKITTTPARSPNTSHGKRGRPRRSDPRFLSHLPAPGRKQLPLRSSSRRATNNSSKNPIEGLDASVNVVAQPILAQSLPQEGSPNVLRDGFPCERAPLSVVVHQQDEHDQPVNVLSKVENPVQAPPSQGVQVTGAKKRKLGSVRRFKQDEAQQDQGELHNGRREKPGNEDVDSTEGEPGDRTKGVDCVNRITRIIKPVRYFATMTDDVQQVSITFKALRSDGQEVLVDDKELKSNNPLVLINYYEQHLRYDSTS